MDIVLNHASLDSVLVQEHLGATYNTYNSPHLKVAFELDEALYEFSNRFAAKKVGECPFAPYVYKQSEVDVIIDVINKQVLLPFKAEEYFCVNPGPSLARFKTALQRLRDTQPA